MEIEQFLARLTDDAAGPLTGDRLEDALRRVGAAQDVAGQVGAAAAAYAGRAAADAVWLGASLADLAETIGNTRQAARKRWPDLGRVYRARRWLEGHDADLVTVIGLVTAAGPDLGRGTTPPPNRTTARAGEDATGAAPRGASRPTVAADLIGHDLRDAIDRLRAAVAVDGPPPARWWALSEAVDRDLRTVAALATPFTEPARHALDAARGTLAHWDAAT
jgi:hypothetical protein